MKIPFGENTLNTLFNKATIGFLLFDKDLKVIYLNESIQKTTGYGSEKILGSNFFELIIIEDDKLKIALDKLKSCFIKPFNDFDISFKKKSGESPVLHVLGSSFEDNGNQYALLVLEDITSRKAIEKVMESSFDNFIQTTLNLDAALKKIKEQSAILEKYQERIKKELLIANSIQRTIIPEVFPSTENIDIWAMSIPSTELEGDYFDFVNMGKNKIGILLADVSGHGVPAALITTMLKVQFSSSAKEYSKPEQFLSHLNKEISVILGETGFYLTAIYSILDLNNATLVSSCAAHERMFYYNSEKDEVFEFGKKSSSTIIGSFKDAEYKSESFKFKKGFKILFFTDGIVEARNKEGEFYGSDRVKAFLKTHQHLGTKEFTEKLIEDNNRFCNSENTSDDRTLILINILDIPKSGGLLEHAVKEKIDNSYRKGREYLKTREYKAAIDEFLMILKYDDKSFGAYSYLGQIFSISEIMRKL